MRRSRRLILIVLLGLGLAAFVTRVPSDSVAVRESYGGSVAPLAPGFHLRVPLLQRIYRYEAGPFLLDEPIEIVSKDKAAFKLPVSVSMRPSPGDLATFHQGCGGRPARACLEAELARAVRNGAAALNTDDLLATGAGARLAPSVSADLISRGISDDGLTFGSPAPTVLLNAVRDYLLRNLPASARSLADQALARDPREPLYHAAVGFVDEAEGNKEAAVRQYLEALYLDPASLPPMSRLFVLYQERKDPDSIRRLQRLLVASLEKDASSAIHHDWLAHVYMRIGRLEDADKALHTAVGLRPDEPEFRISVGALRIQQGKLDEARAAYEEALRLQPDMPLALFNIGVTHAMQGQFEPALEFLHRAERAGPPTFALYNALAQAYEQTKALDRSAEYLRRSLAMKPDQPDRKATLRRIEEQLRKKRG